MVNDVSDESVCCKSSSLPAMRNDCFSPSFQPCLKAADSWPPKLLGSLGENFGYHFTSGELQLSLSIILWNAQCSNVYSANTEKKMHIITSGSDKTSRRARASSAIEYMYRDNPTDRTFMAVFR